MKADKRLSDDLFGEFFSRKNTTKYRSSLDENGEKTRYHFIEISQSDLSYLNYENSIHSRLWLLQNDPRHCDRTASYLSCLVDFVLNEKMRNRVSPVTKSSFTHPSIFVFQEFHATNFMTSPGFLFSSMGNIVSLFSIIAWKCFKVDCLLGLGHPYLSIDNIDISMAISGNENFAFLPPEKNHWNILNSKEGEDYRNLMEFPVFQYNYGDTSIFPFKVSIRDWFRPNEIISHSLMLEWEAIHAKERRIPIVELLQKNDDDDDDASIHFNVCEDYLKMLDSRHPKFSNNRNFDTESRNWGLLFLFIQFLCKNHDNSISPWFTFSIYLKNRRQYENSFPEVIIKLILFCLDEKNHISHVFDGLQIFSVYLKCWFFWTLESTCAASTCIRYYPILIGSLTNYFEQKDEFFSSIHPSFRMDVWKIIKQGDFVSKNLHSLHCVKIFGNFQLLVHMLLNSNSNSNSNIPEILFRCMPKEFYREKIPFSSVPLGLVNIPRNFYFDCKETSSKSYCMTMYYALSTGKFKSFPSSFSTKITYEEAHRLMNIYLAENRNAMLKFQPSLFADIISHFKEIYIESIDMDVYLCLFYASSSPKYLRTLSQIKS